MTEARTIAGQIISLGGYLPEDKDVLFRWINDREIVRFNAAFRPISWSEHCAWWDALNTTETKRSLAIRARADNRIIGTVQLVGIHPVHRHAEVSIRIGDQTDREKGAGTEALRLLVRHAFDDLDLRHVFTHVWADNPRAIRAYANAGFEREGLMPSHVFIEGEWKDVVIMGIVNRSP